MNIKCNICSGDVALSADKTFATCEYCGSTITVPKVSDEQRAAAFNRGNHFRRIGEFDKALASYERILREDDTDAEAHWCAALCRFGIEYVEDPATYEWLPTCHRASFDSFTEDVDYKAALEHSDGLTRRLYQKEGAKISEVQRGILATSQNEEPYDVFLCYKETGADGQRTKDSILAQDIYYQLTDQGHRVFFSRITLEDKAGSQYEPYIFAALNSAKVMVAVGTKPEHFSAVWVKNEWSRFLALMRKDRSRVLLPCYRDMDPYDLPEQLAVLQSYDMGKIGFIQDLIRGVDKVLNAGKAVPAAAAAAPVIIQAPAPVQAPAANHDSAIVMGFMDFENKKYEAAENTFRQVLMQDDTCAEAYLGLVLVSQQKSEDGDDTLALHNEHEAYQKKYCQYTSSQMSALEVKIFTSKLRYNILREYADMKLLKKFADALDINCGTMSAYQFIDLVNSYIRYNRHEIRLEMLRLLIQKGYDLNSTYKNDYFHTHTPLISDLLDTKYPPDIEFLQTILESGADPNSLWKRFKNDTLVESRSTLCHVISNELDAEYARVLLRYGADPNITETKYIDDATVLTTSPILLAAKMKRMDIVALLLEHGADPNSREIEYKEAIGRKEYPLLHRLLLEDAPADTIRLALESGADPNIGMEEHDQNNTQKITLPIFLAADKKRMDIVELLLKYQANPMSMGTLLGDAFHLLSYLLWENAPVDTIRLVLESGADPNAPRQVSNGDWYMPLYDSIWHNTDNDDYANLLIEYGADIRYIEKIQFDTKYEERSMLSEAVILNRESIVALLLKHGADANSGRIVFTNNQKQSLSPIFDSVWNANNCNIAKLLLEHGANPNFIRTFYGKDTTSTYSVLSDATWHTKNVEMVELLLKHGANPSFVAEKTYHSGRVEKESLLHQAIVFANSQEIFTLLIQYGASLDVPTTLLTNCRDIPFRKYPYELNDEWKRLLRKAGWKGPGLLGGIF